MALQREDSLSELASDAQVEGAYARLRTRSLGMLFLVGSSLLAVSLFTLSPPAGSRIVTAAGAGYVVAVLLFVAGHRLPSWALQLFLACGTVMIEWVIYGTGENAATYTVFYFWIAIYAFQYFNTWQASAQVGFVFLSYGVVLQLFGHPTSPDAIRWALTTAALVVSGAMIGALKVRNAHLMASISAAARIDPLTGLLNRRGFDEQFEREIARARRGGERLTLVIGDLDGFKSVNDRFGHQAGDDVLGAVGRCLSGVNRGSDTLARIGGEEFAVLLPTTDEHSAYLVADRLRRSIASTCSKLPGSLTISLGVATFPQHGRELDSLLRAADQALYVAKQLGRDRTALFDASAAASAAIAIRKRAGEGDDQLLPALRLAEALDLRDSGTAAHSSTVGRYAEATALALGFTAGHAERIRYAGIVHDVGKIGVPDEILCKPGALDAVEEAEMQKHPEIGARILSGGSLADIAGWVVAHHEREDGFGYPKGLTADEIPVEASILAVADAYEAMTNERVYRSALPATEAQHELIRGAGTQFNEQVVWAFLSALLPSDERLWLAPAGEEPALAA